VFKKVLIANRGEIALRVIRALKEMNIESVAIYSDADRNAVHTLSADFAYPLEGNRPQDTYSNIDKIIQIAKEAEVDAIHPGYGFYLNGQILLKRWKMPALHLLVPKAVLSV